MALGTDDAAQLADLNTIFASILSVAARLAGLAAVIMIVASGFKYLTSGGDPKQTEQAKHTFTWAVIGLAALVGSWFILRLITAFTGVEVSVFDICLPGTNCQAESGDNPFYDTARPDR